MIFKKLFVFTLLLCSANALFPQSQDLIFWHWELGTSSVVYGDDAVNQENAIIHALDSGRYIISGELGGGIELDDRVRLLTGGIIIADLSMGSDFYANRLDYGLFTGVRIYPNLAGLNLGVDYVLGTRTDYIKLPDQDTSQTTSTPWGNGFCFNVGYDFSYSGSRFAPNVEGSYRMMPRGGTYDYYFSLLLSFSIFP